jgi:DNA-binding ferritin-like protein
LRKVGSDKVRTLEKVGSDKVGSDKVRTLEKAIIQQFLVFLNTVKLYHWKTYSYATHKATDVLYKALSDKMDSFVEVLMGKNGGQRVDFSHMHSMPLRDFSRYSDFKKEIERFKAYLISLNHMNKMANYDLLAIRDEILAELNQFLYLATMQK